MLAAKHNIYRVGVLRWHYVLVDAPSEEAAIAAATVVPGVVELHASPQVTLVEERVNSRAR